MVGAWNINLPIFMIDLTENSPPEVVLGEDRGVLVPGGDIGAKNFRLML